MDFMSDEEEKGSQSKRKWRKNFQINVGFPGSVSSGSDVQQQYNTQIRSKQRSVKENYMARTLRMQPIKSRSVSPAEKKFRFNKTTRFGMNLGSDQGTFRREEVKSISGFGGMSTLSRKKKQKVVQMDNS